MANSDYTKSPDQILLDLINTDNPDANLDLTEVTLSGPTIVTTGTETDPAYLNRKTKMTVTAVNGSGYKESVDVNYTRLHYRDVFTTADPDTVRFPVANRTFNLGSNTLLSHLLPEINATQNLNLQPEDFWDLPLPTFEGLPPYEDKFVKLEAKAESKIFIGGVMLKVNPNPYDLANLPVTTLSGLMYPTWQVKLVNFVDDVMDQGVGVAYW